MIKKFQKEWVNAGYESGMGSVDVLPPPPPQFIRLYHLTSAHHAKSDIASGRLKVARFRDLNDPFELLAMNLRDKPNRKAARNFKASDDGRTGLLCFSSNSTNPVLWSHYGEKHCGVCLGFNLPKGEVQEVEYVDKRLRSNLDKNHSPWKLEEDQQDLLLRTKSSYWKYESEQRVFVRLTDAIAKGQLHFWPFGDDLRLQEVILGPQCELDTGVVRKLVNTHHSDAVTIKARLAFKSFEVVPDKSTISRMKS